MTVAAWVLVLATTIPEEPPVKVTICDLARDASRYSGSTIEVRATVLGRNPFVLDDFESKPACDKRVTVNLIIPTTLSGTPVLQRDANLEELMRALKGHNNVLGTFVGRLYASTGAAGRNGSRMEGRVGRDGPQVVVTLSQVKDIRVRALRAR